MIIPVGRLLTNITAPIGTQGERVVGVIKWQRRKRRVTDVLVLVIALSVAFAVLGWATRGNK